MKKPDWKAWLNDEKDCKLWLSRYIKNKMLRKKKDESALHLRKTDHNLNFANWIFEKHKDEIPKFFGKDTFYDWVVTIYYYAVYHASMALVSKEEYDSKSHSATLCFLISHYYHSKKSLGNEEIELIAGYLSKEDIEILGISKDLRERASYDVHELFERKLAEDARTKAINFINKSKAILAQ